MLQRGWLALHNLAADILCTLHFQRGYFALLNSLLLARWLLFQLYWCRLYVRRLKARYLACTMKITTGQLMRFTVASLLLLFDR